MDGEQHNNCDRESVSDGKWLSCESPVGQSSRRKVRGYSRRRPNLRQKKLPRHWRENDDSLLTELDLLQPPTSATKQSSLLSFMGVGKDSKFTCSPTGKGVRKSITDVHSLSNSNQGLTLSDEKDIKEVKKKCGLDSTFPSSDQDGFIREENSPEGRSQEVDCFKGECFKHKPDTRLFVPLMINEKNTNSDYCDRSHSPEGKEFHILSLRKKHENIGNTEIKTEVRKRSEQSFERNGETKVHRLCYSRPSSSEDEYSEKPDCSYKNYKDSGSNSCSVVPKDSDLSGRHHTASFSEESFSFCQAEGTSHHPCLTLNESQKMQKELYKAQMGTLEFSDFTSDI